MLLRSTEKAEQLIVCMPEELERLKAVAAKMPLERVFACISFLQTLNERFARAADKRIETEMCMVRLCGAMNAAPTAPQENNNAKGASDAEISELKARINELSRAIANGASAAAPVPAKPAPPASPPKPQKKFDPNNFTPLKDWQEILEIIEKRAPALHAFLKTSLAAIEGDTFCLVVAGKFIMEKFKRSNDTALMKEIIRNYYGREFGFKLYSSGSTDLPDKETPINNVIKQAENMQIDVEIKKK
jgi:DNA polymerase-3 subunit gamma/tau